MKSSVFWKNTWSYVAITIACAIYALAWSQVFIPNGILSGGITGLCTVLQYATGFPMSISYGISNAVLLILAFLILGRSFGIRTIYALVAITVFLDVFPMLNLPELHLRDGILIPVIASFMEAFSISVMISHGSSSGGTDIIAMIINKFWPVSLGRVYIAADILIIASIMLIPGKTIDDMIYGYIAVLVFSISLDFILLGRKSTVQILVFSEQYAQIADFITNNIDRGVTALNAVGWYSGKDKKVLLILVRKTEMSSVTDKIKSLDPKAFVAVAPMSAVYGEGFEEIKSGLKLIKKKKNGER